MQKPLSPDATVSLVWVSDPAIDDEAVIIESVDNGEGGTKEQRTNRVAMYGAKAIMDPGSWRDILKFKDGQKPAEFVIGVIPPAELNAIEDECRPGTDQARIKELQWRCFLAALRDIRNGPMAERKIDGTKRRLVPKEERNGIERVEQAWLEETFIRKLRKCALFIGGLAYRWNQLSEDDAKN